MKHAREYRPAEHEVAWAAYRQIRERRNAHHALAGADWVASRRRLDVFASERGMQDAVWQTSGRYLAARQPWTAALALSAAPIEEWVDDSDDRPYIALMKLIYPLPDQSSNAPP